MNIRNLRSPGAGRLIAAALLAAAICYAPVKAAPVAPTIIPNESAGPGPSIPAPTAPSAPIIPAEPPAPTPTPPASHAAPLTGTQPGVLTVGPYDTLHVDMEGQPDLSRDYVVDAAGDIQLPYVGKVRVGGLTVDQAQDVLIARLKKLYHTVNLNLTRVAVGGISVTVSGAIARTGPLSVRRDARLNDVIQPSGPLPAADLTHVQITRAGANEPSVVDLGSYLETGTPTGNPAIKDGDVIFVPSRVAATRTLSVSVVGAVPHPGRFDVTPGTTAYDAITLAGGPATGADLKGIYIESAGRADHRLLDWMQISVQPGSSDVNPVLVDGDKIVVPEATLAATFSIMGAVRTPNTYPLRGTVTLLDALSMAGGFDAGAVPKDTKIIRMVGGNATTIPVNADDAIKAAQFRIEPNDHVIVPASKPGGGGYKIDPLAVIGLGLTIYAVTK